MQKLTRTQKLVRAAMLAALTIVLSVPPLASIRISALEITLSIVPVALGGLLLGWPVGTVLGTMFGIISFIRAFTDPLGMLMIEQNAALACIGCILPRAVVGLVADCFHMLIARFTKLRSIWFYAVAGFACSLCNTLLFLGFIWLVFDAALTGVTLGVILTIATSNGLIEMAVNAVLVAVLARVLLLPAVQRAVGGEPPAQNGKDSE